MSVTIYFSQYYMHGKQYFCLRLCVNMQTKFWEVYLDVPVQNK